MNMDDMTTAQADLDACVAALWHGYVVLGFDTDGDKDPGAQIVGAGSIAAWAKSMEALFDEARQDYDDSLAESAALEDQLSATGQMGDLEHYKRVYAEDGLPCLVEGCRISAQEHHRLAYGWITELRELRKRMLEQIS